MVNGAAEKIHSLMETLCGIQISLWSFEDVVSLL